MMDRLEEEPQKPKFQQEEFVPKYLPMKCPVCNGFGTLKYGSKTCQGCKGKGYILVPNFEIDGQNEQLIDDKIE